MKEFVRIYDNLMVNLSDEEQNKLENKPLAKHNGKIWGPVKDWLELYSLPVTHTYLSDKDYVMGEDGYYKVVILEKPILSMFLEKWQCNYHNIVMQLFGNYSIEAHEIFDEDGPTGKLNLEVKAIIENNN